MRISCCSAPNGIFDSAGPAPHSSKSRTAAQPSAERRKFLLGGLSALATFGALPNEANADIPCRGKNGYALQQCLRDARKQKEEESGSEESARDEYLQTRQFEQPGELVTLPSGIQYREMLAGTGREAQIGSICTVSYIVYRLSSGAYFKYSSGGTPVYLFSMGYGFEGKDDVGSTYKFRLGDRGSLPAAATPAVVDMKEGGRRRILIPPQLGWVSDKVGPRPDNFGGTRRLVGHRDEPLLLEIELFKAKPPAAVEQDIEVVEKTSPFQLPAPPSPNMPNFRK
ncbi:hypothetical protein BSKO_08083 [Bryopsis sp. KO-2023]|nr:hypothetical protein BSKO_08083 [Bryopsis sp. KO-2023]